MSTTRSGTIEVTTEVRRVEFATPFDEVPLVDLTPPNPFDPACLGVFVFNFLATAPAESE